MPEIADRVVTADTVEIVEIGVAVAGVRVVAGVADAAVAGVMAAEAMGATEEAADTNFAPRICADER